MWLLLTGLLVLVLEQKVFRLENLSGGEIFREVFFFCSTALGYHFGKEPGLHLILKVFTGRLPCWDCWC